MDARYLAGLRALGANRLSFGVQSSHAWELKLLDRLHTFEDRRNEDTLRGCCCCQKKEGDGEGAGHLHRKLSRLQN